MIKKTLLFLALVLTSCSEQVDLIVYNAEVYTVDVNNNKVTSFAVKDGKFIYVGDDSVTSKYSSSNIINAEGLPVYPGFIDSHAHFYNLGFFNDQVNLKETKSFEEVLKRVMEFNNSNDKDFIIGRGWDQNDWVNKSFPTNKLLNEEFPDKAIVLRRIDGHAYLVNDFALNLAGIDKSSNIEGGEFVKSNGKLTGVLIDNAMRLIDDIIPDPTKEESVKALISAQEIAFENGLTTIAEAGISREQIELIDSLQKEGVLKIKIYAMIENNPEDVDYYLEQGTYKTDKLNVRSVKVYADGALGSRGASMIDEYSDRRGYFGIIRTPIDSINNLAFKLAGTKFQMNTHAIGDNANRIVLNAYRDALFNYRDPRWRVEHAQVINENDIDFFNYKIIPSVQPTHATSDMYWLYDRVGKKRANLAYAYKELLTRSKIIAFGTDFPVEDISPIMTFYSAVARKDIDGFPNDGFQMENSLNRADALYAMTIFGAYANFEENEKGSIEVGKSADFIILDNDIILSEENRIPLTNTVATFIDGELVFNRRYK
ncbi:MAG: amidohydrolase family protein [Flavobacteriaceae bacterium]|nr:amidohydrolase family protein [Flavobacteriaceae bacterium]